MDKYIINLTQHRNTHEQTDLHVVQLLEEEREQLVQLLTFDDIPSKEEMEIRAKEIAQLAKKEYDRIVMPWLPCQGMIGGAPFFMATLERALREVGITPVYAFSRRESVDEALPGGGVQKVSVFKHIGFVEV